MEYIDFIDEKDNKVMNIYLATPVNGRKEKTLAEKQAAARERVKEMRRYMREKYPDARFCSSFTYIDAFSDEDSPMKEDEIMGGCVSLVMQCDMIVLDDGWENSSGCTVERFVAMQYGKKVKTLNYLKMMDKIG